MDAADHVRLRQAQQLVVAANILGVIARTALRDRSLRPAFPAGSWCPWRRRGRGSARRRPRLCLIFRSWPSFRLRPSFAVCIGRPSARQIARLTSALVQRVDMELRSVLRPPAAGTVPRPRWSPPYRACRGVLVEAFEHAGDPVGNRRHRTVRRTVSDWRKFATGMIPGTMGASIPAARAWSMNRRTVGVEDILRDRTLRARRRSCA